MHDEATNLALNIKSTVINRRLINAISNLKSRWGRKIYIVFGILQTEKKKLLIILKTN